MFYFTVTFDKTYRRFNDSSLSLHIQINKYVYITVNKYISRIAATKMQSLLLLLTDVKNNFHVVPVLINATFFYSYRSCSHFYPASDLVSFFEIIPLLSLFYRCTFLWFTCPKRQQAVSLSRENESHLCLRQKLFARKFYLVWKKIRHRLQLDFIYFIVYTYILHWFFFVVLCFLLFLLLFLVVSIYLGYHILLRG